MKEKLIVIVGPTAVGKTSLSVRLSKKYGGEVISGDSMQLYKGMDIGTAKVTAEEKAGVVHHLIDVKEPTESFSVAEFQERVVPLISEINARGRIPLLVGGTGLYIHSVIKGYKLDELEGDAAYRLMLEQQAEQKGNEHIHNMLQQVDREAAAAIHPNNVRRVIRALEVIHMTGIPFSQRQREERSEQDDLYELAFIGLTMNREQLYARINARVDLMIKEGLVSEVRALYDQGIRECQSVQAIGYKELYDFFDGLCSLEEAIERIKRNSRRYAKRQLTWFRNKSNVSWFDVSAGLTEQVFSEICSFIEGNLKSLSK